MAVIQITSEELLKHKQKFTELALNSGVPMNPTYIQIAGMWRWLDTSSSEQSEMANNGPRAYNYVSA